MNELNKYESPKHLFGHYLLHINPALNRTKRVLNVFDLDLVINMNVKLYQHPFVNNNRINLRNFFICIRFLRMWICEYM